MLNKPDELGRLIRGARLAKGIRQIDLAQYLGIGKSQMWTGEMARVYCDKCGSCGGFGDRTSEAQELWNRRASDV